MSKTGLNLTKKDKRGLASVVTDSSSGSFTSPHSGHGLAILATAQLMQVTQN
jgi:hypothetical protein